MKGTDATMPLAQNIHSLLKRSSEFQIPLSVFRANVLS